MKANRSVSLRQLTLALTAASLSACLPAPVPTDITYLDEFAAPRPYHVAEHNNLVFVSSNTDGFLVMDTSTTGAPRTVSHITAAQNPSLNKADHFKLVGDYAYVGGVGGLVVLDVSNPADPALISFTAIPGIRGIEIRGNLAYVLSLNDGLYIFDVSDLAMPFLISLLPTSALNFVTAANRLVVEGNLAFLKSHPTDSASQGVEIVDISDPANPAVLGGIPTASSPSIKAKGKHVFLAFSDRGGLESYDVSNPASPQRVGSFQDSVGVAFETPTLIAIEGNLLFAWSQGVNPDRDPAGIAVLDITNPADIKHRASLFDDDSMRLESARSVNKYGDKLYLSMYWDQEVEVLELK